MAHRNKAQVRNDSRLAVQAVNGRRKLKRQHPHAVKTKKRSKS